jgi:hypothetical protein
MPQLYLAFWAVELADIMCPLPCEGAVVADFACSVLLIPQPQTISVVVSPFLVHRASRYLRTNCQVCVAGLRCTCIWVCFCNKATATF